MLRKNAGEPARRLRAGCELFRLIRMGINKRSAGKVERSIPKRKTVMLFFGLTGAPGSIVQMLSRPDANGRTAFAVHAKLRSMFAALTKGAFNLYTNHDTVPCLCFSATATPVSARDKKRGLQANFRWQPPQPLVAFSGSDPPSACYDCLTPNRVVPVAVVVARVVVGRRMNIGKINLEKAEYSLQKSKTAVY
ncbi:MAG: hypothetical protein ACOYYS_04295 [Chloroflexota bacterium]